MEKPWLYKNARLISKPTTNKRSYNLSKILRKLQNIVEHWNWSISATCMGEDGTMGYPMTIWCMEGFFPNEPFKWLTETLCIGVLGRNMSHSSPWCILQCVGLSSTWVCPSSLVKLEAFICCPQQKQTAIFLCIVKQLSSSATLPAHTTEDFQEPAWAWTGKKRWTKRPPKLDKIGVP